MLPVQKTLMSQFILENQNIQHNQCSLIIDKITLMSRFFLENQNI